MLFLSQVMTARYYPVVVCVMFCIGTVAQQGHRVLGEHRGHGGQVIHQKISDIVDASIPKATDPFGISQGGHASIHGSHSTHRISGARGVHTDHEGHATISGSHGVQGHVNHGIQSKAGQSNHGIQKSDHTEHRQTLQDSTQAHSTSFQHTEHNIDSGRHSNHTKVIQEPTKSHDHPVPKVQDVHSIHSEHNIPARTTITGTNSQATQGDHEAQGVQTDHGGNTITGGNQGGRGHDGHVSDSNVGHDNHSILNSDHVDHRQSTIHPGSAHGQGTNMEHTGHEIDSVGHSGQRAVVQEVTKLHDLPGQKLQDGRSISDISTISSQAGHSIPIRTSIIKHDNTRHLTSDHKIPVHNSEGRNNINADTITHTHMLSSQGIQETHDSHLTEMNVGHNIPSVLSRPDNTVHSGHDIKKDASINAHNTHIVQDRHVLSSHNIRLRENDTENNGHTIPSHEALLGHKVIHRGNSNPSIEKENNLPRLLAHKIHAGNSMTAQSGGVNPSRQSNVEGSEKMAHSERKSHAFPSSNVHEVPTILQNIRAKHTSHGGHLTPTQNNPEKLAIWGITKEINPSIHPPDANVQPIFESQSHLPSGITQLPSNIDNKWQHSNVRHIKPLSHDAHGSPANFDTKNSRMGSDRIGSGLNVNHHGDRRMNDKVQNGMVTSILVDHSAKEATLNQHAGSNNVKNETKLDHADVVRTRQSNKEQGIGLNMPQELGVPKAHRQLRNENIHKNLTPKSKEKASTANLIGHIGPGELELHPVDVPPSFSDPDNPNLNIDRSREHANFSNFSKGNQNSGVSNSTHSSLNLNDFLENINTHLNNKGFGFSETRVSNSGVPKSVRQQNLGAMKQDMHSISANTGLSFTSAIVSNWAQGQGDIFTGFKHNSGKLDHNNRHRVPSTTPTPMIESTTVFIPQFSAEPTSIRIFAPLMADMMGNRNVYPPIVDPINDPRVPHDHGPMPSAVQNNGVSLFDIFAVEF